MSEEVWKDVVGYEGLYKVSNFGRIKNVKTNKIKNQFRKRNGYMQVHLYANNKEKNAYIHRVVAQAFIPNTENKKEVNHKDLNKLNNNIINLEWCNRKENMQHALKEYKTFYEGKQIICVETRKTYKNSIIAGKETGISSAGIRMNICGKNKTAGGFHWKQV